MKALSFLTACLSTNYKLHTLLRSSERHQEQNPMASSDTDSAVAGSVAIFCTFRTSFELDLNLHRYVPDAQVKCTSAVIHHAFHHFTLNCMPSLHKLHLLLSNLHLTSTQPPSVSLVSAAQCTGSNLHGGLLSRVVSSNSHHNFTSSCLPLPEKLQEMWNPAGLVAQTTTRRWFVWDDLGAVPDIPRSWTWSQEFLQTIFEHAQPFFWERTGVSAPVDCTSKQCLGADDSVR